MSQPSPSPSPSLSPDSPAPPLPDIPTAPNTAAATPASTAAQVQLLPADLTFDGAIARANDSVPRLAVVNATEATTFAVFARLFPFLNDPKQSIPIHGVCQVIPATGELVSACPLPSADVWKKYSTCLVSVCSVASVSGGAIEANEACAISRQDECAWIAATSSVCVPLSLQPLREAQVYLPLLPFSTRASAVGSPHRLLAAHHSSMGFAGSPLMTDSRVTNSSLFLDSEAELGVCLPTLPVGTKCDPKSDPTTSSSGFSLPWQVPLPRLEGYSAPSTATTSEVGQPQHQKSVALYWPGRPLLNLTRHALVANSLTERRILQPPVILLTVPMTVTNSTIRSSSTTLPSASRNLLENRNMYSLVYCDSASREYRAKHPPNSSRPCTSDLDCLFNAACDPSTRRCGAINSSTSPRPVAQYIGNDQFADSEGAPATRDLSSLTVQLIILGIFIIMILARQFRKRIFSFWARVNHKFKGASTTAQRELTLQPASNYMLDDLNDGRRRRRASMQGQQEVDAELGVLTVGDSLPRYHVGTAATAATLGRGTVPRSDTADTLTLPPAFSTMDRFPGVGVPPVEELPGTAEEGDVSGEQGEAADEEVELEAATEHEAAEQGAAVDESSGASSSSLHGSQVSVHTAVPEAEADSEQHEEDESGPEIVDETRALSPSTLRQ